MNKSVEIIIPSPHVKRMRKELHEVVEILIRREIPATIRETRRLWNSKFKISYNPQTVEQIYFVNKLEKIFSEFVHDKTRNS